MATEKQIEANRRNAARSTGPKTEAGKARSRANATTHGLAAELPVADAERSPDFTDRRARWAVEVRPEGELAGWALDRAVAASMRIDSCERAMDQLVAKTRQRARLAWDEDRGVEAAEAFTRLARNPVLAARQLRATLAGACLVSDAWVALGQALCSRDWTDAEADRALDLLGVDRNLRQGRTEADPPEDDDTLTFRRKLVAREVAGLETLVEGALIPLEEGECLRATSGDLALISKPGRLLARYERDAWRRYRESIALAQTTAPAPALALPVVPPPPPRLEVPNRSVKGQEFEAERRALRAEVAPILAGSGLAGFEAMDELDNDDWMAEMERRLDEMDGLEVASVGTKPIGPA